MIEYEWVTRAGLRAICAVGIWDVSCHRRGYVEVPCNHPLYEVKHDQPIPTDKERRTPSALFDCHGGLSFSGHGRKGCPVKSEGWWFGFKCNHPGDGSLDGTFEGEVRSMKYVIAECERLAEQLVDFARRLEKEGSKDGQSSGTS